MALLILGLFLFLGAHSIRIVAPQWRARMHARYGVLAYRGAYSVASVLGMVLIVCGFGRARDDYGSFWYPPDALHYLTGLLMYASLVLIVSAYMGRNAFKARLRHPMVTGLVFACTAHLMSVDSVAAIVLFGAFLAWSVTDLAFLWRKEPPAPQPYSKAATIAALAIGAALWLLLALWLHEALIGVSPFLD